MNKVFRFHPKLLKTVISRGIHTSDNNKFFMSDGKVFVIYRHRSNITYGK